MRSLFVAKHHLHDPAGMRPKHLYSLAMEDFNYNHTSYLICPDWLPIASSLPLH